MKALQVAVVGAGQMGHWHCQSFLSGRVQGAVLAAVCDRDPGKLRPYASLPCFTDVGALIASGRAQALVVATPHFDHTPIAIQALQAGLHVLSEKPLAVHLNDAKKMLQAHGDKKLAFAVMFQQRTLKSFQKLRALVQSGALGAVTRVNWVVSDWFRSEAYYQSSPWRATWAGEGGGLLVNQLCHNLDMLQWIFGMPQSVLAVAGLGSRHAVEVEDSIHALLDYKAGFTISLQSTTGEAPGLNRLEVACDMGLATLENGTLRLDLNAESSRDFIKRSPEFWDKPAVSAETMTFDEPGGLHEEILQNFTDAALTGAPLIAPASEALGQVELSNAILLAGLTRSRVDLPMDADLFERELNTLGKHSKGRSSVQEAPERKAPNYLKNR